MFSSADAKFVILAFSSLFSVINPIEAAPIFVSLTAGVPGDRRRIAFRASLAAALILAVFAATGGAIFGFFGITLPAFQIAGGILFTTMGLTTLRGDDHPERANVPSKDDPSIVPLGMPLIAGPGAISTVMVLVGQARDGGHRMALALAIAASSADAAHPATVPLSARIGVTDATSKIRLITAGSGAVRPNGVGPPPSRSSDRFLNLESIVRTGLGLRAPYQFSGSQR
jgi:multiple antibiotic resistance protein